MKETKAQKGEDTSQNEFSQSLSNLIRGEKLNTIQVVYKIFCFCFSQTNVCLILVIKGNIIFVNIVTVLYSVYYYIIIIIYNIDILYNILNIITFRQTRSA